MFAYGIDLSGPSNHDATALVRLQLDAPRSAARFDGLIEGADDERLWREILERDASAWVGLDAPLSYQSGGGLRDRDRALRQELSAHGVDQRYVLPPTMTRMIYLTARGISLARPMEGQQRLRVVETHPTSALLLRRVPETFLQQMKDEREARERILDHLRQWDVAEVPDRVADSDHAVAALAAAVAVRDAAVDETVWQYEADPPHHPFPLVC